MFEFEFFAGIAGWVLPLASIGIILFWGRSADHVPRWFNWSDVAAAGPPRPPRHPRP